MDGPTRFLVLLKTTTGINMQTAGGAQTLYSVPVGKTFIPIMVVVRGLSASLAGGTDFDFTNWKQNVDLSGMTSVTDTMPITDDNVKHTPISGGSNFQVTPSTGSTGAATATFDVFGYLY